MEEKTITQEMKKIKIPITSEEMEELSNGKGFNWVIDDIEVEIFVEEYDEE